MGKLLAMARAQIAACTIRDTMGLLAIHPNFELYGSDRSFASAVSALNLQIPDLAVTVVLPRAGPILSLPVFSSVPVRFERMWIPRRGDLRWWRIPKFLAAGAGKIVKALVAMRSQQIVYIDTIISFDYILASIVSRTKSIIHVREIPTGKEMKVFRRILLMSRSHLIFNSRTTMESFALPPSKAAHVVYNGAPVPLHYIKEEVGEGRPIRLLMIGRLNAWKGHEVLVAAISRMSEAERARLEVRVVGSSFEGLGHFRRQLEEMIETAGMSSVITMFPFKDDPSEEYRWADVVIVPSTKPEPFGRVAIEAMSYRAAVVASAHGGLTEIVDNGVTGHLFPPSNEQALAQILRHYVLHPKLARVEGDAGYDRFLSLFTDQASDASLVDTVKEIMRL